MIARRRHGRTSSGNAAWPALLACGPLLVIAGCGNSNRPILAPVTGSVTYAGAPLDHGQIVFSPPGGRPAHGKIVQGNIVEVTSHDLNDGAPVGSYSLGITSYPPVDSMYDAPGVSLIPTRYINPATSGVRVEIKAGRTNVIRIDLDRE